VIEAVAVVSEKDAVVVDFPATTMASEVVSVADAEVAVAEVVSAAEVIVALKDFSVV